MTPEGRARLDLLALRLRGFRAFAVRQPLSFWGISLYLFFEYVRPQSIYPAIAVAPWTLIILLFTTAVALVEGYRFWPDNLVDRLLVVFTATVLASSIFAFSPAASFRKLEVFISWVLIYFLITRIVDRESRLLVFVFSFLLYNAKMSQHSVRSWAEVGFQFRNWGTTGAPGWFHNSGEFGIEMTIFMPVAIFFFFGLQRYCGRFWKLVLVGMAVSALLGMVGSSSRGALIGGAAVGLWMLMMSKHRLKVGAALVPLAVLAWLILPPEQMDRFRGMGSDETSVQRLTLWKNGIDMALSNPVLGVGYENWLLYLRRFYGPPYFVSHNIFVQAVSELGFVGLFGFIALIVASFLLNRRTRRSAGLLADGAFLSNLAFGFDGAMIGFLVSGSFVTVLYYPFFWINLAFTSALYRATRTQHLKERRANARVMSEHPNRGPRTPAPGTRRGACSRRGGARRPRRRRP